MRTLFPTMANLIGNRVREIREGKKLTQDKLCKASGLNQPDLSDIENGQRLATIPTIATICQATNISLSRFFTGIPTNIRS